jgi:alkylhydroperoxidase family enzyme
MARLPLVRSDDPDAPALARDLLQQLGGSLPGAIEPNVYRAVANHPEALQAMVHFGTVVYFANGLSPAERELAYLTTSVTNECHY